MNNKFLIPVLCLSFMLTGCFGKSLEEMSLEVGKAQVEVLISLSGEEQFNAKVSNLEIQYGLDSGYGRSWLEEKYSECAYDFLSKLEQSQAEVLAAAYVEFVEKREKMEKSHIPVSLRPSFRRMVEEVNGNCIGS